MLDRKLLPVLSLLLAAGLVLAATASAAPLPSGLEDECSLAGCDIVYWDPATGGNGHYYAFVPTEATLSWEEARALAAASTLGAGTVGHLATISDGLENGFIAANALPGVGVVAHKQQVWIGGVQITPGEGTSAPDENWEWITPETWDYTNWLSGEPNDENAAASGNETYLAMWVHYYLNAADQRGTWNDEGLPDASAPLLGMIVEYQRVPEPATLALLGIASGLLALMRRARRS